MAEFAEPYLVAQDFERMCIVIKPSEIGKFSYVGEFTHIGQYTTIGRFCSIGNLCTIGAQNHGVQYLTTFPFGELLAQHPLKPTKIGNDVWIGSNVIVIAGVTIGDGAVIGGGSVVTRDVSPYAIVAGNPARILRQRFAQSVIDGLLETKWWDRDVEFIKALPLLDVEKCVQKLREIDARI